MILQIKTTQLKPRAFAGKYLGRLFITALIAVLIHAPALHAEDRIPAEGRIIKLTLPLDSGQFTGQLILYNTLTFTIQTDKGKPHRVLWNEIPADKVDRYWRYLEQPDDDPQALFELGDILIRHRDGETLAERAFDQALALDPTLKQAIEQSLAGKDPDGTPRYVGTADPAMWGELSDETMQQGIDTLRGFAERTQRELNIELSLYESDRFMLLTDVDQEQVASLSKKLVQAYRTVAQLLGEDTKGNVFVGKCMVVLFDQRVDYIRFQDQLHDTDARGTGGLCHGFGNGHVHIAAYKRSNPRQSNHIVIHELIHAYLHRHQSPRPLDDWVNEGLAEHLAHTIEPSPGQNLYLKSRLALEGKKGLGEGFYEGENLSAWQCDISGALTKFLIERSKIAYPKLITSLKEGTPTDEALQDVYRLTPAKLTQRFKQRLDRELNKKLGG